MSIHNSRKFYLLVLLVVFSLSHSQTKTMKLLQKPQAVLVDMSPEYYAQKAANFKKNETLLGNKLMQQIPVNQS